MLEVLIVVNLICVRQRQNYRAAGEEYLRPLSMPSIKAISKRGSSTRIKFSRNKLPTLYILITTVASNDAIISLKISAMFSISSCYECTNKDIDHMEFQR
ncbi:hypothetical protein PILCRDRAFT_289982 [Piloderma croceum F 1598]|uniref:Uncharacterized protein n=1 Tax=Piloderma croceum (strain F 1598) TaxID=765440 RepID=A0A0C3BKD7_PILCF|nr:hypothetical protein PILCRDRAFT_289982 [Piloderma croceum F 1598]